MSTLSPLATLVATLTQICQSAQHHHALLSKNEAATRAALIDPVLRALGWDTADVTMVEPEKTVNNAWRADYALLTKAGKVELLAEAKCLGSNLEKYSAVQQLLSYAFGFGVVRILITDGINWHFYNDFKPGNASIETHFNLLHEPLFDCALKLVQWLDAMKFGHGQAADHLSATHTDPVPILLPTASNLQPRQSAKPVVTTPAKAYYPLTTDLTNPDKQLGKPEWLRLPDGQEHGLKTWKDILVKTAELVLTRQDKLPIPLLDKAGKKTVLLSWHHSGKERSSTQLIYQGKTIYLDTHYSASACVANALYLLKLLPKEKHTAEPAVAFG